MGVIRVVGTCVPGPRHTAVFVRTSFLIKTTAVSVNSFGLVGATFLLDLLARWLYDFFGFASFQSFFFFFLMLFVLARWLRTHVRTSAAGTRKDRLLG